ncbi:hypothetical protein FDF69_07900 [Clostridium sporogenes]|uniref:hypothetical protein n=1 Tax=Clostridium sporogenes TaxID=1509 RepID=UPI0013D377EE|nr:hypothetical protein [Clostridium sporogenes]NFF99380.1 hypothetical protein [Clostridium sporogenes]NFG06888.1 hypothetical protein [Clostridium sporogenes]NFG51438.1 hypothetical protein [Clostridium sporogenes]NFP84782.1 hypothetical protein [Clostridium sporogenes]NFQ46495.1 hypothetical protein [Clostridium sporogenes]
MHVRVQFFKGNKPFLATEEQKRSFKEMKTPNPIVENGYIDLDMKEDKAYIDILMNVDTVELFDGVYKIKDRQFRAMSPYALWIGLGEKIE